MLRGGMLAQAKDWLDRRRDDLSDAERGYIEASIAAAKRERRTSTFVSSLAAIVTTVIIFWSYRGWQDAQSWAFLTDLNGSLDLGQDPSLHGGTASIGRMEGGPIENRLRVKPEGRLRFVSRLHLFISRNLQAIDVRSLGARPSTPVSCPTASTGRSKTEISLPWQVLPPSNFPY